MPSIAIGWIYRCQHGHCHVAPCVDNACRCVSRCMLRFRLDGAYVFASCCMIDDGFVGVECRRICRDVRNGSCRRGCGLLRRRSVYVNARKTRQYLYSGTDTMPWSSPSCSRTSYGYPQALSLRHGRQRESSSSKANAVNVTRPQYDDRRVHPGLWLDEHSYTSLSMHVGAAWIAMERRETRISTIHGDKLPSGSNMNIS